MSHHNTAFHQLIKPISRHDFESLVSASSRAASSRAKIPFSNPLGSVYWHVYVAGFRAPKSARYSIEPRGTIAKTLPSGCQTDSPLNTLRALSRLNDKQPASLYEALFHQLLSRCKQQPSKHKFRFKNPLYSLDASAIASAIDCSLKLFPWAAHRDDTANVKLSVGLNHGTMIPEFVALSDGQENDMVQGRKFDFPPGSIVAFDKGYVDYKWFKSLTDKGIFFVTRIRAKSVYRVTERLLVTPGQGVTSDQRIQFNSVRAMKRGAPELRRVGYRDATTGKFYEFLTNNFSLSAKTIAAIYKDRWQVELFFKAIKQNLKIKAFVGRSKNAILTQIWIAMVTYLLVTFARYSARSGWTVQRMLRVLQLNLFERRTLKQIFNPDPPRRKKNEPQLRLVM